MTEPGRPDPTGYLTVAGQVTAELEVKRSRFLATVDRVEDETAARDLVDRLRREHRDARHHCSAYVLGPDGGVERSSDDGEPAGTAGAPMLEVLRGAGLSDTVAVVTRWFGGTLLGAGGLVRAYGDAVRAALDGAPTLRRAPFRELVLELGHGDAGRVESELRQRGVRVLDTAYGDRVRLTTAVPVLEEDALHALVAELTSGAAVAVPGGLRWVDVPTGRPDAAPD